MTVQLEGRGSGVLWFPKRVQFTSDGSVGVAGEAARWLVVTPQRVFAAVMHVTVGTLEDGCMKSKHQGPHLSTVR